MELFPLLTGIAIGVCAASVMLYFFFKSITVARKEYDTLSAKLHNVASQLALTGEKLRMQQELATSFQQKADAKETELSSLLTNTAGLEATLRSTTEKIQELSTRLNEQTEINRSQQFELQSHQKQVAELRVFNEMLGEKLHTQKDEIAQLQKTAHLQFEKIAQQLFEEKSGKFTETNRQNIEALLKPLNENIALFKKKVEETYDKESKERFSLEKEVKSLIENTQRISQEANNLAIALKGQVKTQGDWGETILERILESSGLTKGREYFKQETIKDEDDKNQRPDVIVRLPDDRNIIIDSKVSLVAYLRYTETDVKEEQDIYLAQHLSSIRTHIDQLSAKRYHELVNSLDYVAMFIPVEPAYILAVQSDPGLWASAHDRKVILISPSTLFATLKIVADLWKKELQNKNAIEIARQGARLYDKFANFVKSMEEVGRHITKTQTFYNQALSQLKDGRGNLIDQAEKLKALGVKTQKQIAGTVVTTTEADDVAPTGTPEGAQEEPGSSPLI